MYGRYTKDLGEYAKVEARKLKMLERRRKQEDKARNKVNHSTNANGFQQLTAILIVRNYLANDQVVPFDCCRGFGAIHLLGSARIGYI